jgi:UDP-N-acetylmuramoyl-tripeptide--D-alanyl-D-alanine ligase
MLELGDFSQEAHRQVGASLAEKQIDILITRGEYGKWTIEGAINQGMSPTKLMQFNSNNDIIAWLKEILTEGDRILVKGSRGMQMEEIVMSLQDGRTDL